MIGRATIVDYNSYCREIAEVLSSLDDVRLGVLGKTVHKTFLTRRKYNRGRVTDQMSIIILGIMFKEDKTGFPGNFL